MSGTCELRMQEFLHMKMSMAIRASVADCRAIDKASHSDQVGEYVLSMGDWVMQDSSHGVCNVCMAGVIMRGFIQDRVPDRYYEPSMFNNRIAIRLSAINGIRQGYLRASFRSWGLDFPVGGPNYEALESWCFRCRTDDMYYIANGHFRWEFYEELATVLEGMGL